MLNTSAHATLDWLRSALLRRCVVVLFLASIGIAHAGLLLKPQSMDLLCAPSGAMKLLVKSADGDVQTSPHVEHCALCAIQNLADGQPPAAKALPAPSGATHISRARTTSVFVAHVAPPLPARGPPSFLN